MIARNEIAVLNETLGAKEINELNELLVWAIFGVYYFTVGQLSHALVSSVYHASRDLVYAVVVGGPDH